MSLKACSCFCEAVWLSAKAKRDRQTAMAASRLLQAAGLRDHSLIIRELLARANPLAIPQALLALLYLGFPTPEI